MTVRGSDVDSPGAPSAAGEASVCRFMLRLALASAGPARESVEGKRKRLMRSRRADVHQSPTTKRGDHREVVGGNDGDGASAERDLTIQSQSLKAGGHEHDPERSAHRP